MHFLHLGPVSKRDKRSRSQESAVSIMDPTKKCHTYFMFLPGTSFEDIMSIFLDFNFLEPERKVSTLPTSYSWTDICNQWYCFFCFPFLPSLWTTHWPKDDVPFSVQDVPHFCMNVCLFSIYKQYQSLLGISISVGDRAWIKNTIIAHIMPSH